MLLEERDCVKCGGKGIVSIPWIAYDPRRWVQCPDYRGTEKKAGSSVQFA